MAASPSQIHFRQEVGALAALFAALFLGLALLSYALPLAGTQPALQHPAANWCGSGGFYVAHTLFSFLGLAALVPVGILLYLAFWLIYSGKGLSRVPALVAGVTGMMISGAGLLAMTGALFFPARFIAPGGYLGRLVLGLLSPYLGRIGSLLFLAMVFLLSLMAAVRFSPVRLIVAWLRGCGWLGRQGRQLVRKRSRAVVAGSRKVPESGGWVPTPVEKAGEQEAGEAPVPRPKVREMARPEPAAGSPDTEFATRPVAEGAYRLPSLSLLDHPPEEDVGVDREYYYQVSRLLVAKLADFGVQGTVEGVSPGPVVTTYEFAPAPGVKINKIVSLADDMAMVLKVDRVRIVGSVPGKAAIGIEIPNPVRKIVYLRELFTSSAFQKAQSKLTLALGFDVIGHPVVADLARMPHLLIAGATGAGKSVAINAFIASILYRATPEQVRLLLIDPKRIELSVYEDIPHLLHPVVVEPKMASRALIWAVHEMERRYRLLEESRVKSFASYNTMAEEKLPYVVIIIDELADLMMVASKDVETSIARLAQMARAAGMHIILATQRPSVDVLTGLIKANFPTRISFKVSSKVDSRTILDTAGAEHLLGMGDMLFLPPGAAKLQRIHGAYISEKETERIIEFLKAQGQARYDESMLQSVEQEDVALNEDGENEYDEKYDQAVAVVTETGQASISMVQRRLRVGYNRAARMIEMMEKEGIVGPADGSRPREVLVRSTYSE